MRSPDGSDIRWSIVGASLTICSMALLLLDRELGPPTRYTACAMVVVGLVVVNIRLFMIRER